MSNGPRTSRTHSDRPGARALATLVVAAIPWLSACTDDTAPADPDAGTTGGADTDAETETEGAAALTWWRDIEPVVRRKCAGCHRPGEIAPFALDTYEDFVTFGPSTAWAIETDVMPPWPPDSDCNEYHDVRALDADDKQLLLTYLGGDMAEGDPAEAAPDDTPPAFDPDVTLEMPEDYSPATGSPDDYRCFPVAWPTDITEEQFVTGFEVYPGERRIVHHVIVFVVPPGQEGEFLALDDADPGPGYTCYGGPGGSGPAARWVGAWAPGGSPFVAPEGIGQRILPGSTMILQVHYNTIANEGLSDRSGIGLKLAPTVDRPAVLLPMIDIAWLASDGSMSIPAGEANVTHEATMDHGYPILAAALANELGGGPDTALDIWSAGLHMHQFGTRGRLAIRDADGSNDACLLDIPQWDFGWQESYHLLQPAQLLPGRELHLQCWWDNSADNQPVVDGTPSDPVDLDWGDGTMDEMCLGILYVAVAEA